MMDPTWAKKVANTLMFSLPTSFIAVSWGVVLGILKTSKTWRYSSSLMSNLTEWLAGFLINIFEMLPLTIILIFFWRIFDVKDIYKALMGGLLAGLIWSANIADWLEEYILTTYKHQVYPIQMALWGLPSWYILIKYILKSKMKILFIFFISTFILAIVTETTLWIIGEYLKHQFPLNMYEGISSYINIESGRIYLSFGTINVIFVIIVLVFLLQIMQLFLTQKLSGESLINLKNEKKKNSMEVGSIESLTVLSKKIKDPNFYLLFVRKFPIYKNTFHFLFGPSGSGKSIFIKSLLDFLPEDFLSAGVFIHEYRQIKNVRAVSIYIPQEPALYSYPYYRIKELFEIKNFRICKDIEKFVDQRPQELSAGQKRKVAACMFFNELAKEHHNLLIFLDEPDASLDLVSQKRLIEKLLNAMKKRANIQILYITHNRYIYNFVEGVNKEKIFIENLGHNTYAFTFKSKYKNKNDKVTQQSKETSKFSKYRIILKFKIESIVLNNGKKIEEFEKDLIKKEVSLRKGEIVIIAGKNGKGKSSLLKSLVGVYKIKKGEAYFYKNGQEINLKKTLPQYIAKNGIFIMFEDVERLLPDSIPVKEILSDICLIKLTDYSSIKFIFSKLFGINKNKVRSNIKNKFHGFDLNKTILNYSGGQRQKILIQLIDLMEPELIIMDEPFSRLDKQSLLRIFSNIKKKLQDGKIGVLLVTHNLILVNEELKGKYPVRIEYLWRGDEEELTSIVNFFFSETVKK